MQLMSRTYDEFTGMTEEYWYNNTTNQLTIKRLQDVETNINQNKDMFNSHNRAEYGDSTGGAHLVARIPLVVVEQWLREGFNWYESTDKERRAILNKPENRFLLVRPGKL